MTFHDNNTTSTPEYFSQTICDRSKSIANHIIPNNNGHGCKSNAKKEKKNCILSRIISRAQKL